MLIVEVCRLVSECVIGIADWRGVGSRLFVLFVVMLAGCPRGQQAAQPATGENGAETPRASVALRVLVVNEPGVAEAINRLRGEWAERSGGELSATSKTWSEVAAAKNIDADAIIFPSRYLGELCVRDWLRPVRPGVLDSEDFSANDIYPLVRRELIRWGGQVMALPLGVDALMLGKTNAAHPTIDFLIQAAPSVLSNEREGILFNPQTMKPRISDPEFVDALKRLVESRSPKAVPVADSAVVVPVFGFADRLVAVTTASRNGASAFRLITWLASAEISTQLAKSGERMLPARKSLTSSTAWFDSALSNDDRSNAVKKLETALSGDKCLLIPRIPGVDEYVATVDAAVKAAGNEGVPPEAALNKAAEQWEQITNARGRDAQRSAYLKHLGISGP